MYGILPTREAFAAAFEGSCPKGTFSVRNDSYAGNGDYSESELWEELEIVVSTFDRNGTSSEEDSDSEEREEAGSFASAVLGILGFEWV